ncbi:precorrin-3B synthase [Thermocatellispora tengchongensis]|uniref:Precorrin-3B synthase n=2 Tax=Thermocatellispora tengchongensis TaxID=1073253 RepID=A0A840PK49_9ACTN|nr:precorrin-3B synthase [Thermocatellispora tengchongensis]
MLTAAQLREVAAAARELGSGVIELTSRANLQVRGLSGGQALAARMAAAGLLPSATHERVRNIVAAPLSGRVPGSLLDVRPLVRALDRGLCARPAVADLPGRFLFALDDGTGAVTSLGADVTLVPAAPGEVRVLMGTPALAALAALSALSAPAAEAVGVMLAVAEAFLAEREAQGSGAWRIEELQDGPARIAARLHAHPHVHAHMHAHVVAGASEPGAPAAGFDAGGDGDRRAAERRVLCGLVAQDGGGRYAVAALAPLGRLSAAQAEVAAGLGGEVVITPWRGIVVPDLDGPEAARRALDALAAAGLVTDPASPYTGLTACTGRPGCAKARADVRADAARFAALSARRGEVIHWSGCERRCGRPRDTTVDVVAEAAGYRVTGAASGAIERLVRRL